ncbi:MAG: hypothetical protein ACI4TF_14050 [Oliverpabstia sp.]
MKETNSQRRKLQKEAALQTDTLIEISEEMTRLVESYGTMDMADFLVAARITKSRLTSLRERMYELYDLLKKEKDTDTQITLQLLAQNKLAVDQKTDLLDQMIFQAKHMKELSKEAISIQNLVEVHQLQELLKNKGGIKE